MRDRYNRWWDTVSTWDKVFALLFTVLAAYKITALIVSPSWANAGEAVVWTAFTYAAIGFDYYRALWRKFESLTDFGAAIGNHLHTYGDLLLEKSGDHYKVTPLTHGSRDD